MCLVFKSELAQAHAEKAEDEPPQRARGKPRPTLYGAPLKGTRQIVKKQKFTHPEQKSATLNLLTLSNRCYTPAKIFLGVTGVTPQKSFFQT